MRCALIALCCAGCATVPAPSPVTPTEEAIGRTVDWTRATEEAVSLLAAYLQVDTVNPPGNETRGAEFLAAALEREGITSRIWEFAPGRGSLVARLPATGTPTDKPLCLLSHIDVVPFEAAQWPADHQPLSGTLDAQGNLWGRGALDMKGFGALQTLTLLWLKRLNVPLRRDVILLAVADEEVGGGGMNELLERHWPELDCGQLVNEGGIGVRGSVREGLTSFGISVAEKGALWARLVATGEAGHGSIPTPNRAPTRLSQALARLLTRDPRPVVPEPLYEMLRRTGEHIGGVDGLVLRHPTLIDALAVNRLLSRPTTRAMLTNTCQVTGFEGKGSAPNVIPSQAAAVLDCRLLPGTTPTQLLHELELLVSDVEGVHFEVLNAREANASPWEDSLFDALAWHAAAGREDAVAGPIVSPGFTDSLAVRPKGTHAYGFIPFELSPEEFGTIHGRDERVSKENLRRGFEVLLRTVLDVAAKPEGERPPVQEPAASPTRKPEGERPPAQEPATR